MGGQINFLVPKHKKLEEADIISLLSKFSLSDVSKLPKIQVSDPALSDLGIKVGDVIEITRNSFAGESKYYRVVIE